MDMNRFIIFKRVLDTLLQSVNLPARARYPPVLCEFTSGWWIHNCKNHWYHATVAMNRYIIFRRFVDSILYMVRTTVGG